MFSPAHTLFGNRKRTDYLLALAYRGPSSGRAIQKAISVDTQEEHRITKLFVSMRVIRRLAEPRRRLWFNDRFVAASELRAHFATLGETVGFDRHPQSNLGLEHNGIEKLFGNANRTAVLTRAALCDEGIPLSAIAEQASIGVSSARYATSGLIENGLIERFGGFVRLRRDFVGAETMIALIKKVVVAIQIAEPT